MKGKNRCNKQLNFFRVRIEQEQYDLSLIHILFLSKRKLLLLIVKVLMITAVRRRRNKRLMIPENL